jgi:hypothetical protein
MPEFPHLPIPKVINGRYNSPYGSKPGQQRVIITPSAQSKCHLLDRAGHAGNLTAEIDALSKDWSDQLSERKQDQAPPLPSAIPLFIKVDPASFDPDTLKGFGIEVISQQADGLVLGAAADFSTNAFRKKITDFTAGKAPKVAEIWQLAQSKQLRVDYILSDELKAKWHTIQDTEPCLVDVGIACFIEDPSYPLPEEKEDPARYQRRLNGWYKRQANFERERDERFLERADDLERFVKAYQGEITDTIDLNDSFMCRLKINGIGLKDLVNSYPYVFEVTEVEEVTLETTASNGEIEMVDPHLLAPGPEAPRVCVIDSGIMEQHRLLKPAIDQAYSRSFVPGDPETNDQVAAGGHGTRVAGAILYPDVIPRQGSYQLNCWLQNARILNHWSALSDRMFPPTLMREIVTYYQKATRTRIFNLSVNNGRPCRRKHMSPWAASLDQLIWEHDILFIVSAGNVSETGIYVNNPGVQDHFQASRTYPAYLLENSCRIANPAQSALSLTVGSVCQNEYESEDKKSIGRIGQPSPFSRSGFGMWNMIKPDVVEYGGNWCHSISSVGHILPESSLYPELVRIPASGAGAVARDTSGTSFAAPKVTHIIAALQSLFPQENCLMYRALVAQSARWPSFAFYDSQPSSDYLRHYGYGITDLSRATANTANRITLIKSELIEPKQTHLYNIRIPQELRKPGEEYRILIEVTLSFKAVPRRTRQTMQSYLSSFLEWESSKLTESYEEFATRMIKPTSGPSVINSLRGESIPWTIRERSNWGCLE